MNTFLKISTAFILFFGVLSCRNVPENEETDVNNILTKGTSLVKINIVDAIFDNNSLENNLISENNTWERGGGNYLISNELQVSADVNILDDAYSVDTGFLTGWYLIHAFYADGRSELADSVYCIANYPWRPLPTLKLNAGEKYHIIIVSHLNRSTPFYSINDVIDGFVATNILYKRIDNYEATYGETTLNISLKYVFPQVKFIVDASNLKNVSSISFAHGDYVQFSNEGTYYKGTFYIKNGKFVGKTPYWYEYRSIALQRKSPTLFESYYTGVSIDREIIFDLYVDLVKTHNDGSKTEKNFIIPTISLKPSTRYTYTIKLKDPEEEIP